jgi:hypothetical protein
MEDLEYLVALANSITLMPLSAIIMKLLEEEINFEA